MNLQTIITLAGLGIGTVLLIGANWTSIQAWLPRMWLVASREHEENNPAALIAAYHVSRDACHDDTHLSELTDQLFKELICRKVLRCEK